MRNFLGNLIYKLQTFMHGRYGTDELSRFTIIVSIILILISNLLRLPIFYMIGLVLAIWSLWRSYSKNISKRLYERDKFLLLKEKYAGKFSSRKNLNKMKKTHRLYKCKKCKTVLRVPKGVGKIKITCSKCGAVMTKRA